MHYIYKSNQIVKDVKYASHMIVTIEIYGKNFSLNILVPIWEPLWRKMGMLPLLTHTHNDKHALVYQITGKGLISIIKSSLWKYCYSN